MYYLGISAYYHNSSCCLFKDGELLCAIQEERLTRIKSDADFPIQSIRWVLKKENLTIHDISLICYYENPKLKFERQMEMEITNEEFVQAFFKRKAVTNSIRFNLGYNGEIYYSDHHLSHLGNGIYQSTWEAASFLTVDAVGEKQTMSWGHYDQSGVHLKGHVDYPHSLGLLYSAVTAFLGFSVNDEEFKIMGLAAFGKATYKEEMRRELISSRGINFNLNPFYLHAPNLSSIFGCSPRLRQDPILTIHQDIAKSLQQVLEEELCLIVTEAFPEGAGKLIFSGGVAHNSCANQKLSQLPGVSELFIPASPNDPGSAIGACVMAIFKQKKIWAISKKRTLPFWGKEIDSKQGFGDFDSYLEILDETYLVEALVNGAVVGIAYGQLEFGDRALGNRSILANPDFPKIKDTLNLKIKRREEFRPFAPIVTAEKAPLYFEISEENKLMSKVYKVKEEWRSRFEGIQNVDGSARVQTLVKEDHAFLHALLKKFGEKTGFEMLVNTSFNLNGEPIVADEWDALDVFLRTDIDLLVINHSMIVKSKIPLELIHLYRSHIKTIKNDRIKSVYELI